MVLISIIVPVYNVEPYLTKCVDSILNQTFQDFELILVDDGSPDRCGKMCDEYAKKDARVIVIHKENGGLSDARNAGIAYALEKSESKYLCFFDSDDFVKPDLLERCHNIAAKYEADIVCFGLEMTDENLNRLEWGTSHIPEEKVYSGHERFLPILPPTTIGDYACNKMFKKELFAEVTFPFGKKFEDVYTSYRLFAAAQTVALIPDLLYMYIRRDGSITRPEEKRVNVGIFDFFNANIEKYNFISNCEPQFQKNAIVGVAHSAILAVNSIVGNQKEKEYGAFLNTVVNTIGSHWDEIDGNQYLETEYIVKCGKLKNGVSCYKRYLSALRRKRKRQDLFQGLKDWVKKIIGRNTKK